LFLAYFFSGSAVAWARSISAANKSAIFGWPLRSARARPSWSTSSARATLPLARYTPALRKTRAYSSPWALESMNEEPIMAETLDSILGGALCLYQPRRGYRFSVEAVLLARFAAARPTARVLELGAGCGVVALIVAACVRPREVVAV